MWGDDPNDYKNKELNDRGFWQVKLPVSQSFGQGWIADLRWIFEAHSEHPIDCIVEGIRSIDHWKPRFLTVEQQARDLVKELLRRYQENCVPKAADSEPKKVGIVYMFATGSFAVFDSDDNPVPELHASAIEMWKQFAQSKGYATEGAILRTQLPGGVAPESTL